MVESRPTRRRLLELGGAAMLAFLAGCSSEAPTAQAVTTATEAAGATSEASDATTASNSPSPYTRVYRETAESVVLVKTDVGRGSGFLVDTDTLETDGADAVGATNSAYVVTNAHVVDDAETADLRLHDGRWAAGQVVGTDPRSDLAVIEFPTSASTPAPLSFIEGDAVVGQEVVAIGNPFDLAGSMTTGIVSGLHRSAPAPTGARIPDAIQTDAAINPGNSGGPLLSLDGRVVAVINSETGENVGFGISAALARRVVSGLIADGSYEHPFLGVALTDLTPELADAIGLDRPRGVLVTSVLDDGPSAGILRGGSETQLVDGSQVRVGGDVILSLDRETVRTTEDLSSYLTLETCPGARVDVTVRRDGTVRTLAVELGTRPSP